MSDESLLRVQEKKKLEIERIDKAIDRLTLVKSNLVKEVNELDWRMKSIQIQSCGKQLYIDERHARKHMKEINALIKDDNKKLRRSYFCTECKGWHLTSQK